MGRPPQGGPAGGVISIDPMKLLRQYWNWIAASVVVGVIAGVVLFIGLRLVWPRYDSAVTFEVFPQPADPYDPDTSVVGAGGEQEMEAYMETQVFVMRSDRILKSAVEDQDVQQTAWAKRFQTPTGFDVAEMHDKLQDIVSVHRVRNTQIIILGARTRVPRDATVIAGTIADTFLSDVRNREIGRQIDLKRELETRLGELRSGIDSVNAEVRNLLARNTVTSINETNSVYLNQARNLQSQLVQIQSERSQKAEALRIYEAMLDEPGGAVFPEQIRADVEQGPLVRGIDAQISELRSRLRALEENGSSNGTIAKGLRRNIVGRERQRQEMVESRLPAAFDALLETLRNDVRNLQANETELLDELQETRNNLNSTTLILQQHEGLLKERDRLQDQVADIENRIASLDVRINRPIRVRKLDDARLPDQMAFPKPIPVVGLATFLIPALVTSLVVLRELREQRVRGPQDVALIPRIRVFGVVPDTSMDPSMPPHIETAMRDAPGGVLAEAFRQMRTHLLKESRNLGHRSILVFSGMPGSGTTSFISNISMALAETDTRVLVIDANVRRPKVASILEVADRPGLTDVLLGRSTLTQATQSTTDPNLAVLGAGERDQKVFERFPSSAMAQLIVEARELYDIILIDAPPAVVSSDAMAIAQHCDASVLVTRAFSEKRGLVARLRGQFSECRAQFLGVVVNGVKSSAGGYFKRNFRATHEYGREAIEVPESELPDPSANGTLDSEV